MRYGKTYSEACDIQRTLKSTLESITCKGSEVAQLARAWIEVEWFKRELRGLPRMKSADAIALLKRAHARAALTLDEPAELAPEPKHSFSPTVTAPPTPDAPSASDE